MKLQINNISKNFKNVKALDDLSIEFETGKIYALLGRNGAGKSTLMNIITNRLFPSSGTICIDGDNIYNNDDLMSRVFLMGDDDFFGGISCFAAFKMAKTFDKNFNYDYALELAKDFELNLKTDINKLSTGYSSIFKVILAFCSSANFVLFDEPVLGLDAPHRDLFYKLLIATFLEKEKDVCYIVSTHLIDEIANLAQDAIIINDGKLVSTGAVEELSKSVIEVIGPKDLVDKAIINSKLLGSNKIGKVYSAYVSGALDEVEGVTVKKVDLQRMFIEITKGN
ncbi:MAG: ABC transporter ATP-binding protein [Sphaerochaetaceae bacterium]|nr:ABC transporter ATP-binding protein [Sphaerochaetaceae bacterium]